MDGVISTLAKTGVLKAHQNKLSEQLSEQVINSRIGVATCGLLCCV